MRDIPTCVVINATNKTLSEFQDKLGLSRSAHLYIGLDGKITCFVPDDEMLEKFDDSIGSLAAMGSRNRFINLLEKKLR